MVTYFVINDKERIEFEKKFQAPYGYTKCKSYPSEELAIEYVEGVPQKLRDNLVVERFEGGEREIVYKGCWYDTSIDYYNNGYTD